MGGLKHLLPRSLFGRVLLMLLVPLLAAQAVSIYIFYDRHWQTVSRRLALALGGEIALLIDARQQFGRDELRLLSTQAATQLEVETRFERGAELPLQPQRPTRMIYRAVLERAIAERIDLPFVVDDTGGDSIAVHVQLADGVLTAVTTDKRVFTNTIWLVTAWSVGVSLLVLVIGILFLRSLTRPIVQLAGAADAFGAGDEQVRFKPSGALEVRQAAISFVAMRDRIQRQIRQRNAMLSGVSHDLQAPLARIRATLDRLGGGDDLNELKRDVEEMRHMLDGYLAFIGGEGDEAMERLDIGAVINAVASDLRRHGRDITVDLATPTVILGQPNALKRCFGNLVDNAARFARTVKVSAELVDGRLVLAVDDDGPGIPANRRKDALRPFVRLDPSRNPGTGGTGLGLAIANDIVHGHGGELWLADSPLGGLRVCIALPALEVVAATARIT